MSPWDCRGTSYGGGNIRVLLSIVRQVQPKKSTFAETRKKGVPTMRRTQREGKTDNQTRAVNVLTPDEELRRRTLVGNVGGNINNAVGAYNG